MRNRPWRAAALSLVMLSTSALLEPPRGEAAPTFQDFDAPGTPFAPRDGCGVPPGHPPTVISGGPTGNFLRLATKFVPSHNTIAFERVALGGASRVTAEFDIRMTPGVGRADGLGFAWLNTSNYLTSGTVCPVVGPLFVAEEPNFLGSVGVGFDIHEALGELSNNHVSIHWDGRLVAARKVPLADVDLAAGQWIHVTIEIVSEEPAPSVTCGEESRACVTVRLSRGDVTLATVGPIDVPGLEPYEGRAWFGARSGFESADHDLDNVNVVAECSRAWCGRWSAPIPSQIVGVHAALLRNGKVFYWEDKHTEDDGRDDGELEGPRLFDPVSHVVTSPPAAFRSNGTQVDMFCAGHALGPNGCLFVAGGHEQDLVGLPDAFSYCPIENRWTELLPMNGGRWYPSVLPMPNGDMLVVSGALTANQKNDLPQIWQRASREWRDLFGAQNVTPLGGDLYPRMFLTRDGRVVKVGPDEDTWFLEIEGAGKWVPGPPRTCGSGFYGPAVMYDDNKIAYFGGGDPPSSCVEVLDLDADELIWIRATAMPFPLRQHNATILPNGHVLVTGGTQAPGFNNAAGGVLAAAIWDPVNDRWSVLAPMTNKRLYHSFALLLPNASVVVGGSGQGAAVGEPDQTNFEIFEPPYLFDGDEEASRPLITSAPATIGYGQGFFIATPDAAQITGVHMIRLSSATHAWNAEQRIAKLTVLQRPDGLLGLNIIAPSNPNLAPPGDYMLFLLDGSGVPSVATFIKLSASEPDIDVAPTSWDYGNVPVGGTSGKALTVRNDGTVPLTLGAITLGGANPNQFKRPEAKDLCSGTTLGPTEACTLQVKFKPKNGGRQRATLRIPSNDPDENLVSVKLRGTGDGPEITVEPMALDFGGVPVGTGSVLKTVTVRNDGTAPLTVGAITLAGANPNEFKRPVAKDLCSGTTLGPTEACTVKVKFRPKNGGPRSATLLIPSNDFNEPVVTVTLSGTGL